MNEISRVMVIKYQDSKYLSTPYNQAFSNEIMAEETYTNLALSVHNDLWNKNPVSVDINRENNMFTTDFYDRKNNDKLFTVVYVK